MKKVKTLCALALVAGAVGALASCDNGAKNLKVGVGMISAAPAISYGSYQLELNFAVAAWDNENKVAQTLVDVYQIPLGAGDLDKQDTTYFFANGEAKTKRDRHDDYAMKDKATKGEWYEQAENLENWAKGKSVSELAPDADTGAVAAANVSIQTGTLLDAIKESNAHKKENAVNASGELTLALGHNVSYAYTGEVLSQINIVALGVLLDGNNTIQQAYLDEIQIPVSYTNSEWKLGTANQVGHDSGQAVSSKKEMGSDYGMSDPTKAPQGDWYVQAAKFEDYLVGKKANEVAADSDGKLAAANVSISTGTYFSALKNAIDGSLYNSKKL